MLNNVFYDIFSLVYTCNEILLNKKLTYITTPTTNQQTFQTIYHNSASLCVCLSSMVTVAGGPLSEHGYWLLFFLAQSVYLSVRSSRYLLAVLLKKGPSYLCTAHFAIDAMAAVAFFLPMAAVGKLQPCIVASLPNTYDYTQIERDMLSRKSAVMSH